MTSVGTSTSTAPHAAAERPAPCSLQSLSLPSTTFGPRGHHGSGSDISPIKPRVLPFSSRGGARRGAGRKRTAELPQVPHRARAVHDGRRPVHVTLKTRCRSLRTQFVFPTVRRTIAALNRRRCDEFRIVEFSVQSNHVHLLIEAASTSALSSGMRSFNIRLARSVNQLLFNAAHSSPTDGMGGLVELREPGQADDRTRPNQRARTWLLCKGWLLHGLISVNEKPKAQPPQHDS